MIALETFAPSVAFALAAVMLIALVRWKWRRQARPGYAPLWAWAYVLLIVAGLTVCGVVIHGIVGTGRHRKTRQRPAQLWFPASWSQPWAEPLRGSPPPVTSAPGGGPYCDR